ncbi:MAG: hypothetical protein V4712_03080 [Pseudomonadota bacterium]
MDWTYIRAIAIVSPILVGAWLVPQFASTKGRLGQIALVGLGVVAVLATLATRSSGYNAMKYSIPAFINLFGLVAGCLTQLWLLYRRRGGDRRPGELMIRLVSAGLTLGLFFFTGLRV